MKLQPEVSFLHDICRCLTTITLKNNISVAVRSRVTIKEPHFLQREQTGTKIRPGHSRKSSIFTSALALDKTTRSMAFSTFEFIALCIHLERVIAVCIYRSVMMSIDLSKTFTPHMQMVTGSVDLIVTQLLRYHMLLLYCKQPFNLNRSCHANETTKYKIILLFTKAKFSANCHLVDMLC